MAGACVHMPRLFLACDPLPDLLGRAVRYLHAWRIRAGLPIRAGLTVVGHVGLSDMWACRTCGLVGHAGLSDMRALTTFIPFKRKHAFRQVCSRDHWLRV
jgi:hypothetical protein